MPYGFTNTGANAHNALQEFLLQREAQQRQAMLDQLLQKRQAEQSAMQEREMALREQEFSARQGRQAQLDAQAADQASAATRKEQNTIGVRGMMADAMTQGLTPESAKTIGIMAFREGMDAPPEVQSMLEPPEEPAEYTLGPDELRYRGSEVIARGNPRPTPSASAASDALVKVDTMENGKRVTKWLPKSQVAGQTFESPSGGPTLASGQQRRILNFYNRMREASETIDSVEPQIAGQGLISKAQGQYAPNILQTPLQQSYRQAQRAFTEARLRKESGAAIPPHEYENDAITYFAQPGDDPATIEQKRTKRAALLESTAFEAGPAYEEFHGAPFTRSGGDDGWTVVNGVRVRRKPR